MAQRSGKMQFGWAILAGLTTGLSTACMCEGRFHNLAFLHVPQF
jgi:hypothetical protein